MPGCRRTIIRQPSRCKMAERNNRASDSILDAADLVFARRDAVTPTRYVNRNRYGDLTVLYPDRTGRRIACRCRCTKKVSFNIDDLESGAITNCGCSRPSLQHQLQLREMATIRRRTIEFNNARA